MTEENNGNHFILRKNVTGKCDRNRVRYSDSLHIVDIFLSISIEKFNSYCQYQHSLIGIVQISNCF
jgi:hypothetical protein